MVRVPQLLATSALLSLISCGLIGKNNQDESALQITPPEAAVEDVSFVAQQETSGALTGFAAGSDGSLIGVTLRLSEDGSTAWISVDGAPERIWTGGGSTNAGEWTDGVAVFLIEESDDSIVFQLGADYRGVIGALTDIASLPSGVAGYNGTWRSTSSDGVGQGNGSLRLDVDFASGDVNGGLSGAYHRPGSGGGSVKGEFVGSVDGAVIVGSALIDGAKVTGNLLLMGGIYGERGEVAEGVLGGELTTSAGSDPQSGGFLLNLTGR